MSQPISPLTPLPPDPTQRQGKKVTETKTVMHRLLVPMTLASLLAIYLQSFPLMLLGGVVWFFWIAYYLLVTQVLLPSGSTTPSVNQHSNIGAMVARGAYDEAVQAYRAVIASDPQDVLACEQLAQLALRELKNYDLAVFAYREAERRAAEPKRRLGYGLMIAGIYRDNLQDPAKTIVELRRILAQHPDVPNAASLRAEIREIKTAMSAESDE